METTLKELILKADVKGLSALHNDIVGTTHAKVTAFNKNKKILEALTKADFNSTEEYSKLFATNEELNKEILMLASLSHKTVTAINILK